MKQALILLFLLFTTMTLVSQENPVLLFPEGAPGETKKLKEVEDLSGNRSLVVL